MSNVGVVFVLILAGSETAFECNHLALAEILADKFGSLSPRDTGDKIGIVFACALVLVSSVQRDREAARCYAALGLTELRIGSKSAD